MIKYSQLLPILFLICAALWSMRALFHPGFYTSHDGWHQVARLYHFDQATRDGQFPPRWAGHLMNGFGYPIFIFSYHLPWWLAEPLVLVGMSIFDAIKFVFFVTFVLSGLPMYFWISEMWGRRAGLISAFLYLFTPYRFANIFVRANIGEAVSFLFIPLIFWGFYRLHKKISLANILLTAVGVAGCLLSHIMIVILFAIPGFLYTAGLFIKVKTRGKFLGAALVSALLGIGISAYYLLPAIVYKPLTVFTERYHNLYQNYFTPLSKLIYSPWGYGAIGTAGEMSRQVGLVLWGVSLLAIIIVFLNLGLKKNKLANLIGIIFIASFFISIYLMIKESLPAWKLIEPFALLDFPTRFLAVTTFVGSVLAGFIINSLSGKLQTVTALLLITAALVTNRHHLQVNQYTDIPLSLYVDSELSTNTDDEYLPKWVDRTYARQVIPLVNGDGIKVSDLTQNSQAIEFSYTSSVANSAAIHHMYFPGFIYLLDQKQLPLSKSGPGGISIQLPQGIHQVYLRFKPTTIMRVGEFITFISLIVVSIGLLKIKAKSL